MSSTAAAPRKAGRWLTNPWRKPRFLQAVTLGYLIWSTVPVLIAVLFSFNDGKSRSTWQGFSLKWWYSTDQNDPFYLDALFRNESLRNAMIQTLRLSILTVLIAVPLGTAFAIGIDRWRGRPARGANFVMLLSFVVPEMILGIAFYLLFIYMLSDILSLGTTAQVLALVTFQMSYSVVIVRARLLTIGPEFEEAAMDLGARPAQALRRTLLPLLTPAILASTAVTFADCVDNFVIVRYLSGSASSEPLSVKVYSAARSAPTPAVNAAATAMLVMTMVAIAIGYVLFRKFSKGTAEGSDVASFSQL